MLQQATKEKYSIETLRERNVSYDHEHGLTQKDVDMANSYVELIERTRSEDHTANRRQAGICNRTRGLLRKRPY